MARWLTPVLSCLLAGAVLAALHARRRYMVITVAGTSMAPSFQPGDRLLLRRSGADRLSAGTAVVLRAPACFELKRSAPAEEPAPPALLMVKRLAAVPGETVPGPVRAAAGGVDTVPAGMFVVLADNPTATDSRHWGFVAASEILGPVVRRLFPAGAGQQ